MVQTYQSPVRVYKYPFELVMAAYEKRFPTCPLIPIFVGSDTTFEFRSPDKAEHVVERRCRLNIDAPYILKKLAGVDYIIFIQKNALDWRKRTLDIHAHNQTFSSRLVVNEHCQYYVHPENSEWTCFEQSASLDVKSFFGFEATVEKLAVKHYAASIQKGKEIIEHYVQELISQGVSNLPLYQEPAEFMATTRTVTGTDSGIAESVTFTLNDEDQNSDNEVYLTPHNRSRAATLSKQPGSQEDAESKLEAEYIHRFLGDLTPLEESRLCELRYWLNDTHKGKLPNDAHLLRFLRARDFDVQRAREMLVASMQWRKQHQVDKILSSYRPPSVLLQFFPGSWHHSDSQGRPLYVLRFGQLDVKGLLRSVGEDSLVKWVLSICEEGLRRTEEATFKHGRPISSWTLLVDLDGLSMRHLWRPGVRALLRIIEIVAANYPETMALALVVRAPRVAPVLWTLLGPFIDERTRLKFMIYGGNDYCSEGGLVNYIDRRLIPDFLGGGTFCLAPDGGVVPKSLYLPEESISEGRDRSPSVGQHDHVLGSMYQKGLVYRGLPHEVLCPVKDRGCVLTWDFDVVRGECEFVVLRTPKEYQPEIAPSSPGLSALSPTGLVAAISHNSPAAFDRALVLGTDLFVEVGAVRCYEGDSIQVLNHFWSTALGVDAMQGSHYCSQPGSYVLQWRCAETLSSAHSNFDFSLPTQRCKVMYYHELLNSVDFRGSMASLESCRSSFSTLSLATSGSQSAETPGSSRAHNLTNL